MKKLFYAFILIITIGIHAQEYEESDRSGIVTYKSSKQVYVSFESTDGINKGDILYVNNKNEYIPAMIVDKLSGSSCSGKLLIEGLTLDTKLFTKTEIEEKNKDILIEVPQQKAVQVAEISSLPVLTETKPLETSNYSNEEKTEESPVENDTEKIDSTAELSYEPVVLKKTPTDENTSPSFEIVSEKSALITEKKKEEKKELKSDVTGKISVQSYSNISNLGTNYDYQRWRYTFQLGAKNIGGSNFSYTHYLNFAYRAGDWNSISSNLAEALRIYDLAIRYDFSEQSNIWFGRHLNPKISNISAIDGLQYEHSFSNWSAGAIIGSRPDFNKNMGFNLKLFEYGVYVNRFDNFVSGSMSNTLSYFDQTNDFKTDRRFIYFQHSNSAIENTRLFLSTEVDLFKKEMGVGKTEFSLTSLFVSANIRPSDIVSFYLSYDARKNVIYYETFKSIADSILENETRQGFRTRVTLKPVRSLYIGANYGYRFRPGDIKPSNNYGAYLTYSAIPLIDASSTISFTSLASSYVEGKIWGIQLSKPVVNGLDFSLTYRNIKYKFNSGADDLDQHSFSASLFTYLLKPVTVNLTYEGLFEKVRTSGRILINIAYRF